MSAEGKGAGMRLLCDSRQQGLIEVAHSLLAVELVGMSEGLTPCASAQPSCVRITSIIPDNSSIQQHGSRHKTHHREQQQIKQQQRRTRLVAAQTATKRLGSIWS